MKIIFAVALLFSSSAFATRNCFPSFSIRNFESPDPTILRIDTGREHYSLTVSYCQGLDRAQKIAFQSFSGSQVCVNDSVLILDLFTDQVIQSCRIFKVEKL